ncbi:hypothetical protein [Deefgea sp. CFH1-16]|uniref:hypothetical protein n=1 Tax=Deefgea sp. CFH1-16 TaxID=2675457 RepID=UPI0015F71C0F|nr:hypothetical protein [Deefgea sp. CFH1-16]MBM5574439.1 hypothetical protein [Deefgea sp. CFH1-16]
MIGFRDAEFIALGAQIPAEFSHPTDVDVSNNRPINSGGFLLRGLLSHHEAGADGLVRCWN